MNQLARETKTMSQAASRIAELEIQIGRLSTSTVLVETNAGTFGAEECRRATGSGRPADGTYEVYEEVRSGRLFRSGPGADAAPGRPRRLGAKPLAEARQRLEALRAELKRLQASDR